MYRDTPPFVTALVVLFLLIGIVAGLLFVNNNVSAKCFDWWPFNGKTCVISAK